MCKRTEPETMEITAKQIHDIAQDLQTGLKVYINLDSLELKSILDFEDSFGNTDIWEEELEQIENEWTNYTTISKMESWEAYKIIEDFVEKVQDQRLKEYLIKILNRKSPFANFKAEVESSSHRQKWFDFRDNQYENYVREQLEYEKIDFER